MNEFLDPKQFEISEPTLSEAIEGLHREIESNLEISDTLYGDYRDAATKALRDHPDEPADYVDEQFPSVTSDGLRRICLARACIYAIEAEQAMQRDERDSAWYRVSIAQRQLGLFDGSYCDPYSTKERTEFASLGGQARGVRTAPVRKELIRMLNERRPERGWIEARDVIKAVEKDLFVFSERHGGFLTKSGFPQAIRRWLQEDRDVRAAFEGSRR
ncbi:hypothetical protein [Burkholderia gladioli]|uniref:hypothetical protein n=1 Tax=Burkholderia gladioli TaxID=28095 RepID=UPI001641A28B|nr:hypothetical protein [Burkholderia gladioli]